MGALAILALCFGLVCALAPLAQAARILATESAHDVSLIWLSLYWVGSGVWFSYGIAINSVPLIASQATALLSVALTLALATRHRRRGLGLRDGVVPSVRTANGVQSVVNPRAMRGSTPLPDAGGPPTVERNPGKEEEMVTAEFSVTCEPPEGMSQDEVVRVALEPAMRRGLKHEVEPLGTTIEGELKAVFEAVEEAHELLAGKGVNRLTTTLRIEDKRGGTSMDDKLEGFREPHVEPARGITET
jgi:uncharacterized protein YqgV (UPF0045/DUF77 family)/uncharacterized protein with PQ loop repeat